MNKFNLTAIISSAAVLIVSGSAIATGMEDPKTNQASYWGENCTKTEMNGEVLTYTVQNDDVNKVIVKGGTDYVVYEDGKFTNLTAPENPKNGKTYGISHVIECKGPINNVDPVDPEDPVNPIDPVKPVNPADPAGNTEDSGSEATDPIVDGKGAIEEQPVELPKTGASSYISLATGLFILVSIVGYRGALSFIANRLS